jgi:two-component system cell cycle response regulator
MRSTDSHDMGAPAPSGSLAGSSGSNAIRVLLTELRPDAAQTIAPLLSPSAAEITVAASLSEALDRAARTPPDVVVLLLSTARERDSVSALTRLRASPALRHVPVVLVAPVGRAAMPSAQAFDLGPVDCVRAPVDPNEFVLRVVCLARLCVRGRDLERLAVHDAVTGLYNRHYLNQRLASEVERSKRYGQSLSIIIADLDHFKRVNDTHGHIIGDLVLRAVARTLRVTVRTVDLVARMGGEEFAVLAPSTPLAGARVLAERLRVGTASAPVVATTGSGVHASIRVTMSLGVASMETRDGRPPPPDAEALLEAADAALYRAKTSGRNRVEVHEG